MRGYTDLPAPVAQGIERCPAEAEVACSNHAGRTDPHSGRTAGERRARSGCRKPPPAAPHGSNLQFVRPDPRNPPAAAWRQRWRRSGLVLGVVFQRVALPELAVGRVVLVANAVHRIRVVVDVAESQLMAHLVCQAILYVVAPGIVAIDPEVSGAEEDVALDDRVAAHHSLLDSDPGVGDRAEADCVDVIRSELSRCFAEVRAAPSAVVGYTAVVVDVSPLAVCRAQGGFGVRQVEVVGRIALRPPPVDALVPLVGTCVSDVVASIGRCEAPVWRWSRATAAVEVVPFERVAVPKVESRLELAPLPIEHATCIERAVGIQELNRPAAEVVETRAERSVVRHHEPWYTSCEYPIDAGSGGGAPGSLQSRGAQSDHHQRQASDGPILHSPSLLRSMCCCQAAEDQESAAGRIRTDRRPSGARSTCSSDTSRMSAAPG